VHLPNALVGMSGRGLQAGKGKFSIGCRYYCTACLAVGLVKATGQGSFTHSHKDVRSDTEVGSQ
jgi:hypothetical protein